MERKIGEIFEYNGELYQCVIKPFPTCEDCDLYRVDNPTRCIENECLITNRSDKKSIVFKKLEKVGEPFSNEHFGLVQKYELKRYSYSTKDKRVCFVDGYDVFIKIKQNKEDMEEKKPTYEELLHYYHSTVGLWAIDRSPQEVDLDWICKNAFQLGIDGETLNHKTNKLKPFNFEAAKLGKPVCTRDGRPVRILCCDKKHKKYPIVALVKNKSDDEEYVSSFTKDGKSIDQDIENRDDLMMLPEKKEGWVNVYNDAAIYDTKERAELCASTVRKHIATVKIEWEE